MLKGLTSSIDALELGVESLHRRSALRPGPGIWPARAGRYFWILPVEVLGSGPKTTVRGTLKRAMLSRQKAIISSRRQIACLGPRQDEGAGMLAPCGVGPGHHRGLQHLGMAIEHLLDLEGGDVLAAGDDDVLGAVLDLDIAVGMAHAEIAGVEPAAARRPRRSPRDSSDSPSSRCCRAGRSRPWSGRPRASPPDCRVGHHEASSGQIGHALARRQPRPLLAGSSRPIRHARRRSGPGRSIRSAHRHG